MNDKGQAIVGGTEKIYHWDNRPDNSLKSLQPSYTISLKSLAQFPRAQSIERVEFILKREIVAGKTQLISRNDADNFLVVVTEHITDKMFVVVITKPSERNILKLKVEEYDPDKHTEVKKKLSES